TPSGRRLRTRTSSTRRSLTTTPRRSSAGRRWRAASDHDQRQGKPARSGGPAPAGGARSAPDRSRDRRGAGAGGRDEARPGRQGSGGRGRQGPRGSGGGDGGGARPAHSPPRR